MRHTGKGFFQESDIEFMLTKIILEILSTILYNGFSIGDVMGLELISYSVGTNWIAKLYKKLKRIRRKRQDEINKINDFLFNDPLKLVKFYVEPDCQETNPADRHEADFITSKESIFKKIREFQENQSFTQDGNNQMFILSDAGMGKTSLLVILKLLHITTFRPKIWSPFTECVLIKLGKDSISEIEAIKDKISTFLLLDALDEDPTAYGDVKKRLIGILNATKSFYRVIITCRTQFFPKANIDPLERPGIISVGGYICPSKYLSHFNDEKVDNYLKKRLPKKFLKKGEKQKKVKDLIRMMGSLRCRPMLLSYIDQLLESSLANDKMNEFNIYKALVDSWLFREERKNKIPKKELLKACEILALEMQMKNIHNISESDLDSLIKKIPDLDKVKAIDIKGRSLLNRSSEGHYRFSHYNFQEFLVVRRFIENHDLKVEMRVYSTDFTLKLLLDKCKENPNCKFIYKYFFFKLNDADLQGVDLQGVDLQGADLQRVNFQDTNLRETNLQDTNLQEAILKGANLQRANLQRANLQGVDLQRADLQEAELLRAYLRRSNLKCANLQGANLKEAELLRANFQGANLQGANLQKINLRGGNLRGANLDNTNLRDADLRGVDFQDAKNITFELLSKVKTLFQVIGLSPGLKTILKKKMPKLFEEPLLKKYSPF